MCCPCWWQLPPRLKDKSWWPAPLKKRKASGAATQIIEYTQYIQCMKHAHHNTCRKRGGVRLCFKLQLDAVRVFECCDDVVLSYLSVSLLVLSSQVRPFCGRELGGSRRETVFDVAPAI